MKLIVSDCISGHSRDTTSGCSVIVYTSDKIICRRGIRVMTGHVIIFADSGRQNDLLLNRVCVWRRNIFRICRTQHAKQTCILSSIL